MKVGDVAMFEWHNTFIKGVVTRIDGMNIEWRALIDIGEKTSRHGS